MTRTIGLLLAAGAGRRMGKPKALLEDAAGVPWVVGAARVLSVGGCGDVVVVIGAAADEAGTLLRGEPVTVTVASDWAAGMGSSLRAGLNAIADSSADAAIVHLVDLPDVGSDVVRRILARSAPGVLARASYGRGPGHPVLLGRDHWSAIAEECAGDAGARAYLARHTVDRIDCSDLATGVDIDESGAYVPKLGQ
ncbi:MAG: NTP transferase domain-containing protein [Terrimesophilobacter sp.]